MKTIDIRVPLLLCWPALVAVVTSCKTATDSRVLATYRDGVVTRAEYESWKTSIGREPDQAQRVRAFQTIAVNKSLASVREKIPVTDPHLKIALLDMENQILARELRRYLTERIEVDEAMLEKAVVERRHKFTLPKRVRLRNISKRLDPKDEERNRIIGNRMAEIRQSLLDGANFDEMVQRESESQTRFHNGYMGYVWPGQLRPDIEALAMQLKPGELSTVLENDGWLTLLRCEDIAEAFQPSDAEIRANLTTKFRKAKLQKDLQSLRSAILETATIHLPGLSEVATARGSDPVLIVKGQSFSEADILALLKRRNLEDSEPDGSQAQIREAVEEFAVQLGTAEKARELELDRAADIRATLHWRRVALLANYELKERVKARFTPIVDSEIRAYYEANAQTFRIPEQFRIAAVAIRADPAELRDRYYQAEQLLADIRAGKMRLEEAAAQYSSLPSATDGGRMGWLTKQQIAAYGGAVVGTVAGLQVGQVSDLVQQQESLLGDATFWIVKLLEKRPARPMTYEQAKKAAENRLGNMRTREIQQKLLSELIAGLDLNLLD